ncbi:uncharacterized protein LOC132952775 [Metopolophium dirhodum]|uniref:uncharacterized protein LOC132952775 n=1 Tax=Metopolophium dirhodum TaxID=44670 RepID=UPI00298F498E|nr:uncharacterized protein LOC132952775 [Metopolophium dirhodum]
MDFLAPVSIGDIHNNGNNTVDKLTIGDLPPMTDTSSLFSYTELLDPETSFRYKIPFNNDAQRKYRTSNTTPYDDLEDIKYHKQIYVREKLNLEQAAVFDHVTANPNDIVVLQGGPGTGKTFAMLTVANHFLEKGKPPNAVIFKRDAVHDYRFSANGYTVAQFMMRILHLNYSDYETLERQLSEPMSVEHFLNAVVYLTRKLTLCPKGDDFRHPLLILDLYTVKPKPFLLVIMMTLHRYRIGAVICGDKNQLQNIYNSTHAGQCSAYDIVSTFSTKTFHLSHNLLRCSDPMYNDKVNFIGTLSNDSELDEWGYALVSAMFYENLIKTVEPADTILARYHKYLTGTLIKMVTDKKIPKSNWYIENSGKFILPSVVRNCGKFSMFLPLIVGNPYFVNVFSERMLCTLEKIYFKDEHQTEIQTVTVRMSKTHELRQIERGICSSVMFEKHLAYLLNGGDDMLSCDTSCDDLYNFPLYPAFIKTIHMSMGRTIPGRVSLILTESTYQCLYVAISRVTSSESINSVGIPNTVQHFISVLLNFDVTDLKPLDIGQIKEKILNGNYVYYDVPSNTHYSTILDYLKMVAEHSLTLETKSERVAAREHLKQCVVKYRIPTRVLRPDINQVDDDQSATYRTTLPFLLKMKNTITSLATLTPLESRVWIHEFLNEPRTLEYMNESTNSVFSEPSDFHRSFELLNCTCDFTVSNTYKQGETSMDFMKKTSTQKCKEDLETDPYLLKEWVVMTAADDDESPLVATTTTPTTNDNTFECVQSFIYNLVHRDRGDSNQLYELLKKRIKNNTKKRTI